MHWHYSGMRSQFITGCILAACFGSVGVCAQTEFSSGPQLLRLSRSDGLASIPGDAINGHVKADIPPSGGRADADMLKRLSGIALLRSPQLRDAEAAWHAAQMDIDDAKGARWPRVDVNANSKSKMFGTGNPYGNGTTNRATLSVSYTLYDGGKIGKQISAREYQEQSARAKFLQVREQTAFDTVSAYLQILKYRRLVELHQQNIERLELLVAKMSEIVQTIVGRRSELTQATARLLQAKDSKTAAEARLREYEIQLLKLVGPENLPKAAVDSVPAIAPIAPEAGMEAAQKGHPLLLAAEADKLALTATAEAIRKGNYWPTFDLQASKTSGVDIMGYSDPGQMYVALKWNLFQGLSGRAQEKSMLERANAAQEKYQQTVFEIEYKLNSAWADYTNQMERVASLKVLATNTEQVRSDYFAQWETLGRRTLLEVLTAENEHVSTMVNLATGELDQQLASARLRFESGTLALWLFSETP